MIIDELKRKFQGKRVLIVGLGLLGSGIGLARFFSELDASITVTDLKSKEILQPSIEKLKDYQINFVLGKHNLQDFLESDYLFKGPSVRWDNPNIVAAQKKGIPIFMESSFFAGVCPAKIIGVTGTRGKSTTSKMIFDVIKANGKSVYLAGNVPNVSTISLLNHLTEDDYVVLELSSWQLAGFHAQKISPDVAVFTNFYPDHLNYYETMDDYLYDKEAIYLYQKKENSLIVNENLKGKIKIPPGNTIYFSASDFSEKLEFLKGSHNLENAAAAYKVAEVLGLDKETSLKTLINFNGLPYRQQIIAEKDNVIVINDTTSTTPVAAVYALDSFSDKSVVLILGGNAKKLPYDNLINKLSGVKKIVLLAGSFTDEILPVLTSKYPEKLSGPYDRLEPAIEKGLALAYDLKEKCYLLFSPAATSFAMFNNEFHRGDEFNKIVLSKCKKV